MEKEEADKIIKEIQKRVNSRKKEIVCSICGNKNFIFSDGYIYKFLTDKISPNIVLGGKHIPSVSLICNNCGHIVDFAIGVLGLLPKNEDNKNDKKTTDENDNTKG